ncbi:hypothetical protein BVY03_00935 [bacterium K02(2017)]|nr:hypothetical protein BVY03_00935 [bacterium K02(2017)]
MNLDAQQKAFFLITLKLLGKDSEKIINWLPEEQKHEMLSRFEDLKSHDANSIQYVATSELRHLSQPKNLSYLADVHNDWIIDLVKDESVEMISTIMRYLPPERVNAILSQLPESIISKMPKMSQAFAVSNDLVNLLKQKFESFFVLHKDYSQGQEIEFEHLCLLNSKQLHSVFKEVGYRELSLALKSIPQKAKDKVLGRLLKSDREQVEFYDQLKMDLSPERFELAQKNILDPDIGLHDAQSYIVELGFKLFVLAALKPDQRDLIIIKHKMSKDNAKVLQIMWDKQVAENTQDSSESFRVEFIESVKKVMNSVK